MTDLQKRGLIGLAFFTFMGVLIYDEYKRSPDPNKFLTQVAVFAILSFLVGRHYSAKGKTK